MRKLFFPVFLFIFIPVSGYAQTTIQPAGKPQRISMKDHFFMRPSWAPSGDKLAFTGANQKGIWILELSSNDIFQLSDKSGAGYKFSWSPDGEYIAYRARYVEKKRARMAIEVVQVESRKIIKLSAKRKRLGLPLWGRDNKTLFFTRNEKLFSVDTGISVTKTLQKRFLPPENEIVFTRYQKLQIAQIDRPDSLEKFLKNTKVINPVLSPDGNYIACEEYVGDLIVLNRATGKRVDLGTGHRPAWSPDGKWVCYMVTEDDGHRYLASDIYISSIDGKRQFNLTQTDELLEMNPNWSPDGTAIAYDELQSGVIYIQKLQYEQN